MCKLHAFFLFSRESFTKPKSHGEKKFLFEGIFLLNYYEHMPIINNMRNISGTEDRSILPAKTALNG